MRYGCDIRFKKFQMIPCHVWVSLLCLQVCLSVCVSSHRLPALPAAAGSSAPRSTASPGAALCWWPPGAPSPRCLPPRLATPDPAPATTPRSHSGSAGHQWESWPKEERERERGREWVSMGREAEIERSMGRLTTQHKRQTNIDTAGYKTTSICCYSGL